MGETGRDFHSAKIALSAHEKPPGISAERIAFFDPMLGRSPDVPPSLVESDQTYLTLADAEPLGQRAKRFPRCDDAFDLLRP